MVSGFGVSTKNKEPGMHQTPYQLNYPLILYKLLCSNYH